MCTCDEFALASLLEGSRMVANYIRDIRPALDGEAGIQIGDLVSMDEIRHEPRLFLLDPLRALSFPTNLYVSKTLIVFPQICSLVLLSGCFQFRCLRLLILIP